MKERRKMTGAVVAALIAVGFALPVLAQGMPSGGGMPGGGMPGSDRPNGDRPPDAKKSKAPRSNPNDDAEGAAEDLRLKGRCDLAVPMLRKFASRRGYEISQYGLGLCLLVLAKEEHDGSNAAAMNKEGAEWILRAANAGFARAQAEAVRLYVDGLGVDNDPVEAAKWSLLYDGNGYRTALGLPDIAPDLRSKLDATLNDETRKQAQRRADDWTQTTPVEQGEP